MQFFAETFQNSEYIYGTGCDILDLSRIEKLDDKKKDMLAGRVLSDAEYKEYESAVNKNRFLAVRFSVKESIAKSFKTGFRGFAMRDITIRKTELGAPYAVFSQTVRKIMDEKGIICTEISVSHDADFVISTAVALKK